MAVESAADRAAFLNPDEFGERVRYHYRDQAPIETAALWTRPSGQAGFANTDVNTDIHSLMIERSALPEPKAGGRVVILSVGKHLTIIREPELTTDGAMWMIAATERD